MVQEPQLGNCTCKSGQITEGCTQLDVFKFGLVLRELLCYVMCVLCVHTSTVLLQYVLCEQLQQTSISEPNRQLN